MVPFFAITFSRNLLFTHENHEEFLLQRILLLVATCLLLNWSCAKTPPSVKRESGDIETISCYYTPSRDLIEPYANYQMIAEIVESNIISNVTRLIPHIKKNTF